MAARRKNPKTLLKEAIDADDNLAILKAHRMIIVQDLITIEEPSERVKLSASLTQVNREIIKLEGAKEQKDAAVTAAYQALGSFNLSDVAGESNGNA